MKQGSKLYIFAVIIFKHATRNELNKFFANKDQNRRNGIIKRTFMAPLEIS